MAESHVTATEDSAPSDLISFLKAIPDGRFRRGVRYPKWFLLLVAVLGILSGCRSSRDSSWNQLRRNGCGFLSKPYVA